MAGFDFVECTAPASGIRLLPSGCAKLTDFGLARGEHDLRLTERGNLVGTTEYMSPEQASGLPKDFRSDLFSLGGVLDTLATGKPPFEVTSIPAVPRKVCEYQPVSLRKYRPDLPEGYSPMLDGGGGLKPRLFRRRPALARDSRARWRIETRLIPVWRSEPKSGSHGRAYSVVGRPMETGCWNCPRYANRNRDDLGFHFAWMKWVGGV